MYSTLQNNLSEQGFFIMEDVFNRQEIKNISEEIERKSTSFQENTFGIRCFLQKFPSLKELIFTPVFEDLMLQLGENYQVVRSIYFDKPPKANWVVNWHQDLTINLKEKKTWDGFIHWLPKEKSYYSVQPPDSYLKNIITLRIHLDDCNAQNGALRVIPKSHQQIGNKAEQGEEFFKNEQICEIKAGGLLLMKPLLWHSSKRVQNEARRRVIHLEICNLELPKGMEWAELE